ncbi:hypothetical protein DICPUDRAFT_83753 [Dictyostelium purpureum]|uniref:Uncharacterized protein n=1 Tax=Dictyostelium purpureum TaxID=5786 RepID=F1A0I3_DICPU|nr:uncharacterized protein DICPUDRAFT_83753 [Dictyostelium purpureum]EGC30294.1 hypothetical protein DICPUDRAFT_83753 [Dictyostelium purpureum]|eukprot:XP_003293173.1 hypothetical protein DICPUDRAFT_83753 [Dictyostelium purpureum]
MADYILDDIEYQDYTGIEDLLRESKNVETKTLDKGNFFSSYIVKTPISIKIGKNFEDCDFVGIPFVSSQVQEIINNYTITKVNKQLKKQYEVVDSKVAISDTWMLEIVEKVKEGLGIDSNETIDHQFNKMVISTSEECTIEESNDYQDISIDDEEDEDPEFNKNDHIATVILTLPSKHQGGDIVFNNHSGTKRVVSKTDYEYTTAQEIKYLALYTDCPYNIESIDSGYHVYLIYKLYKTSSRKYSAKFLETRKKKLREISVKLMKEIRNVLDQKENLVYLLEGVYKCPLLIQHLAGEDKEVFSILQSTSVLPNSNFKIFFGHLEILREGSYDGQYSFHFTINSLVDFNNTPLGKEINIQDFSAFLPVDSLFKLEPYSVKKRGIQHGSVKIKYSKQVLLILKK